MRVIGVDGGLAHMGVAVMALGWSSDKVNDICFVTGAVFETKPSHKKHGIRKSDDNMRRARELAARLDETLSGESGALVYEAQSFGMKGAIAARQAGTAFGVLAALAHVHRIPMLCVTPLEIKRAMCGPSCNGAPKEEIIRRVMDRHPNIAWPTRKPLHEHLADAVGAVHAALKDDVIQAAMRAELFR